MPHEEHLTSDSALQTFRILATMPVKQLAHQIFPDMCDLDDEMRDWIRTGQEKKQSRDAEVWFTVRTTEGRKLRIVFNLYGHIPAEGVWSEISLDYLNHKILDGPTWRELTSILDELAVRVAEAINLRWEKAQREVPSSKRLLTPSELAERYGVHRATIWRWSKGPWWLSSAKLPAPVMTSKGHVWREEDLDKWDAEQATK